jgi:hypothetical protein
MLTVEISNIYKRGGRTRKVHNLVCVPSMDAARALNRALARVGNLGSDGRPILGLDSRDLLEMVLETGGGRSVLIPAHIWTPWFSALGSRSGFDSIQECYGDLADHLFALETGLSSDPPMNWRLSALDRSDFERILTEPENALCKQYEALMSTEGIELVFSEEAVGEVARIAAEVNERMENIGARRLHTVMEKLLDELSFEAPEIGPQRIVITEEYVKERLSGILDHEDLSRYIL